MTEKIMLTEYNTETGKTIFRPLTPEELTDREELQAAQEALQAEQDAKVATRASALAKLAALGLTQEEIGAL